MSRYVSYYLLIGNVIFGLLVPLPADAAIDEFPSDAHLQLDLLPIWTGMPAPISTTAWLWGSTRIQRDSLDSAVGDPDTINAEIVNMHLWGHTTTPFGQIPVHMWKLDAPGQISEWPGTSPNGAIDLFPANSFFDVFFEWAQPASRQW